MAQQQIARLQQQQQYDPNAGYNNRAPSFMSSTYRSAPSVGSRGASTMGKRTYSRNSLASTSRSLGASKASIASHKSCRSTIQQEHHDRKVQHTLNAPWYGKGKTPFIISIVCFIIAGIVFITGIALIGLRANGHFFLSPDQGEFIGPVMVGVSLVLLAVGIKFMYDAYKLSAHERKKLRFRATNDSMVSVNSVHSRKLPPEQVENLVSGTRTKNAMTREPLGSRNTLTDF